jgi:cysteinyl-tRNA synthetase
MSQLTVFNSLKRQKEAFKPLDENHVRLYACGPTVYNYAHIGNARMAVVFDLLADVMRTLYPKVTYVSNITDVDDKIITAHKKTGAPINEITEKFTNIYNKDMASLGVSLPDIQPLATEHIGEMIALIEQLITRKHAYEPSPADGHVLFNVPSFDTYGGLSGRSRDEQIAGARVEVASYKKDPADFVLWKPSADDEPGWDSPWGRGRPGWHIECSAMAEKHLGLPFDIHGGGADLKFPHHENEIAQSCCAHGHSDLTEFSNMWMHNGFVTVDGEKMSKSLGNFLLVHDLIQQYEGEALRLTLLPAHYRQPLDWSDDKIAQSKKQLDRFYQRLDQMAAMEATDASIPETVMNALCDDLNTPLAMAEMSALLKQDNSPELKAELLAAGKMLGLLQHAPQEWLGYAETDEDTSEIEDLIAQRGVAKKNKDWPKADEIRNKLAALKIEVEDTPDGPKWRKI